LLDASRRFFGLRVVDLIVRHGEDKRLERDRETGDERHTLMPVYREMLLQICSDYPGLPDPRELSLGEIRFFYNGLRAGLKKHTSSKTKSKP
jgi:hypothetical protein